MINKIQSDRIFGLDSIRAVASIWVFLSHLGKFPLIDTLGVYGNTPLAKISQSMLGILFNGTAAVIAFFVISGFCIRLSTQSNYFPVGSFWVRRFVRVGGPLIAAVAISKIILGSTEVLDVVLWSLYCELIYYFLYPFLCYVAFRASWHILLFLSVISACALVIGGSQSNRYIWSYGVELSWIFGLPAWLTGVIVANNINIKGWSPNFGLRRVLWLCLWCLSIIALVLHFHFGFFYTYSMIPFGFIVGIWLLWELRAARLSQVNYILEWFGVWSFSLYLCHKIIIGVMDSNIIDIDIGLYKYIATIILSFTLSVMFYYSIERPFHYLARRLAKSAPVIYMLNLQ